ncbi:MAG: hypothetical protein ABIF19_17125 [Planctomycetota bacterium]|uniref:Head-tail joining protein n=1 Tax=viral metagenome TaxID=1070528 RepID=A0A6M3L9G0_9ZZZZ
MLTIPAATLARMKSVILTTMRDACLLGIVAETTSGTYVTEAVTWATAETACGFTPATQALTAEAGAAQANFSEGILRLPLTASITGLDRIRLTKRYGRAVSPVQEFRIDGAPQAGIGCHILKLVAVTPGGRG